MPAAAALALACSTQAVHLEGKRAQFYMPWGAEVKMMTCGSTELYGRVMSTGVAGDRQQWYDQFRVRAHGREVLSVGVRDATFLLPSAGSATKAAPADPDDATVLPMDKRALSPLEKLRQASQPEVHGHREKWMHSLTTINVTIEGADVPTTLSRTAADEKVAIAVTQDKTQPIGLGYAESVIISAGDVDMQMQSTMAHKFPSEIDRIKKMHMDLVFTRVDGNVCAGVLPELWGIRPMSRSTARLLMPPDGNTTGQ